MAGSHRTGTSAAKQATEILSDTVIHYSQAAAWTVMATNKHQMKYKYVHEIILRRIANQSHLLGL